jgi:hypothetical protein
MERTAAAISARSVDVEPTRQGNRLRVGSSRISTSVPSGDRQLASRSNVTSWPSGAWSTSSSPATSTSSRPAWTWTGRGSFASFVSAARISARSSQQHRSAFWTARRETTSQLHRSPDSMISAIRSARILGRSTPSSHPGHSSSAMPPASSCSHHRRRNVRSNRYNLRARRCECGSPGSDPCPSPAVVRNSISVRTET